MPPRAEHRLGRSWCAAAATVPSISSSRSSSWPSIAATSCTLSSAAVGYSPTRRPLRSTVIRSEISYTWSRKCDTNRIAVPPSRSRRITRNSSATSSASRLDVGSSRISTRAETAVARAMATSCWTAIGWAPRVDLGSMVRSSSPSSSVARRVHRAVVDPAEAAGLTAQQNVLGHSQIGAEVDLLVDGADAGVLRLPRAAEPLLDAVDRDAARVDVVDAGERLDQRRLAGAVLPHQRVDLAGQQTGSRRRRVP